MMTGIEPQTVGVGNDRSTNFSTNTDDRQGHLSIVRLLLTSVNLPKSVVLQASSVTINLYLPSTQFPDVLLLINSKTFFHTLFMLTAD